MEIVTKNVLRHVYEALQVRKRLADNCNISNLQLFYNRLMREYSAASSAEKKSGQWFLTSTIYQSTSQSAAESQGVIPPLSERDVDNFYAQRMTREEFLEIIYTRVLHFA